jgi:hypothetical protein
MGRYIKHGFDYYPFLCSFFQDDKVVELQSLYGNDAIALIVSCSCIAFGDGNYYLENKPAFIERIHRNTKISKKKIERILQKMVEINYFSEDFLKKNNCFSSEILVKTFEKIQEKRTKKIKIPKNLFNFEELENAIDPVKYDTKRTSDDLFFPKKNEKKERVSDPEKEISGTESKSKSKSKSKSINYLSSDEDKSASPCQETHTGQLVQEELKDNFSGVELSEETDPEEQVQTIPIEQIDYKAIMEDYNRICGEKFPQVKIVSEVRRKNIKARSKELKEHGMTWEEFFQKVAASDFLAGNNNHGFVASFDWIVLPTNMAKIVNGNYDNRKINERKYNNGYYEKHDPKYNPREPGRPEDYNDVWAGYPR